ncbi:MAG: hypothetical protein ACPGSH_02895, partial [Ilumatobacteraceae bacterium]
MTMAAVWQRAVSEHAGRPFLTFEAPDGSITDWSYDEFDIIVNRTVGKLRDFGVGSGSAVHLALTNSPTFIAVWLAASVGSWLTLLFGVLSRNVDGYECD